MSEVKENIVNEEELSEVSGGTGSIGRKYGKDLENLAQGKKGGVTENQRIVSNQPTNALRGDGSSARSGIIRR